MLVTNAACVEAASISCNPYHLALEQGSSGSTSVSWLSTAGQTIQVYVSVSNGTDVLLTQQSGSGSYTYSGVTSPNYYVFKLYDGTSHSSLLAWTSVTTQPTSGTILGMNTGPSRGDFFRNANYDMLNKEMMHLSSVGGGVYRLNVWQSGYISNGQWIFDTGFQTYVQNVVNWLKTACYQNNVRVVLAFHNSFIESTVPDGEYWWQKLSSWGYFMEQAVTWAKTYVDAIEADPAGRKVVIGYDYQNEIYQGNQYMYEYLNHLYDNLPVPMGKRVISISYKSTIADYNTKARGGRRFDYVDLHFYPDAQASTDDPASTKVPQWVNQAKSLYGSVTVYIGEMGQKGGGSFPGNEGTSPYSENDQKGKVQSSIQAAASAGCAYWMLWDFITLDGGSQPNYGLAYTYDQPKNSLGMLCGQTSIQGNGDAETVAAGVPTGWSASGTQTVTLSAGGPSTSDAATNRYYARANMASGTPTDYIYRDAPVIYNDALPGKTLYANAYIRSSVPFSFSVREFDSGGNLIREQWCTGEKTPLGWSWLNAQQALGAFAPVMSPSTRRVVVRVRGSGVGILDADCVSVYARRGVDDIPPYQMGAPTCPVSFVNAPAVTWSWQAGVDNPGGSGVLGYHLFVADALSGEVWSRDVGNVLGWTVANPLDGSRTMQSGHNYWAAIIPIDGAGNWGS
ncbi:MAG: hypothetical protein WCL39_14220, partial [Armatimonadota bacterium]